MIDWQSVDTVLLDMDGTLLDLHFDHYFWFTHLPARYAQVHKIDESEARELLGKKIREREGTLQWYCLDHWSELVGFDVPALKHEVKDKIQLRPFVEVFLTRLREINKRLILITNAHPKGLSLKLDVTQIDQWLDLVISSHEFLSPKEDQHFWEKLATREHFDPSRTVFIDDTPRVLRSAQQFGIAHIVCVTQPDSQRPALSGTEFIDIAHFDEIMP